MRGATSVVQKAVGQSVASTTESLGSDAFVKTGFVHILQDAALSMRMRSTDVEDLPKTLGHNKERNAFSVGAKEGAKRALEVTSERYNILLRLND